jgi:hypothetical protein
MRLFNVTCKIRLRRAKPLQPLDQLAPREVTLDGGGRSQLGDDVPMPLDAYPLT